MKKSNFAALILGTIGIVFFALGMCMCLIPEWNMFQQGMIAGGIGLVVLLVTVIVWRRMEGIEPIKLTAKTIGTVLVGIIGALLFGVGLCLCLVAEKYVQGIIVGLAGMVVLLMLIPLTKGLH